MSSVIYEVSIEVDLDTKDAYLEWHKDHRTQLLKLDGFTDAKVFEIEAQPSWNANRYYFLTHYYLKDRQALENYLVNHAATFRADAANRFGTKYSATRRILLANIIK